MKIRKEVRIGIIFVSGLVLLVWGINFLRGKNFLSNKQYFYAVYEQVGGLIGENPVLLNGLKVGQVENIYFHPDKSGKIIVKFSVSEDINVPKNTIAKIFNSDIMGSKALDLKIGKIDTLIKKETLYNDRIVNDTIFFIKILKKKKNGQIVEDTIRSKTANDTIFFAKTGCTLQTQIATSIQEEVNIQLLPVKQKAERLMLSLDSVLAVVQSIFNEQTRENLTRSFESIKNTIGNLEHTTYNFDTLVSTEKNRLRIIIGNIESITYNLKNNNENISNIINNFSSISDSLAKADIARTINNADKALANVSNVMDKINRGEGSVGLLVNNDSLYMQLSSSSKNLNKLLEDMKENPSRYVHFSVFGKKDKSPKK